jgi:hypothetical protein
MDSSRNVNNYDMLFKIVLIGIIIKIYMISITKYTLKVIQM